MVKKAIRCLFLTWLLILSSFAMYSNVVYALSPASETIYQGIDISAYQGNVDFNEVKNAGIDIVYIKASEGDNFEDPYFRKHYDGAINSGLNVGFYHFVRARTNEQAISEAEFFAKVISNTKPNCKLAMDFEVFGNLNTNEINSISKTFLQRVEQLTGKEMIIYSNTYDARAFFSEELARIYPLWVAQYDVRDPSDNGKWNNWVGFQYSDIGRISGINGNVDLDRFTKEIFLSNSGEIKPPSNPVPDEIPNIIYYTVKRGDTLSKIAAFYGVSVEEIVEQNSIANPNLIFVGEVLKITTSDKPNSEPTSTTTTVYTVRRGDNLWTISRRYGTTINSIVFLNNIQNPNLIYPGQKLIIRRDIRPNDVHGAGATFYRIGRGDNLTYIANRYHTTVQNIVRLNNIQNPNLIYPRSNFAYTKQLENF